MILALSKQIGLPVATADDGRVGEVEDLTVRLDAAHPLVNRLLVKGGRSTYSLVAWADLAELTPTHVTLRPGVDPLNVKQTQLPLEADELLLVRDVLDTLIVDLQGSRRSRVSDVLLSPQDDGRLEVTAVDVGGASLLWRTGLGWLAGHQPPSVVDWSDLHLMSGRGHRIQLATSAAHFHQLDSEGLAELLSRLSTPNATDVIRAVDAERAAAAIHHSHPRTGRRLVQALSPRDRRRLTAAASPDHARTLASLSRRRSPPRRRRFRRTAGWRLHRPPKG
jgi:hypothetical protein